MTFGFTLGVMSRPQEASEAINEILPGLYLGDVRAASNLAILQAHSIRYIINAAYEVPNYHISSIEYVNLKLDDDILQGIPDKTFELVNQIIKKGPTLIHCAMGISRSTTMVLGHLITVHGMTLYDALAFVRKARSAVDPNPGFMARLTALENKQKNEKFFNEIKEFGKNEK
jgi:hypothetical protein